MKPTSRETEPEAGLIREVKPRNKQIESEPDYDSLQLAKPTLIKMLEYGLNELFFKKPVKVIDVRVGMQTMVEYEEVK